MTADDVWDFVDTMAAHGVRLWIDGGWAVDACLGTQTREHADLDIAIEQRYVDTALRILRERGYGPEPTPRELGWNFVLRDDAGHEIDFHVIVRDGTGRGIYGPPENGESYPPDALCGRGTIAGRGVDCISPQWLVVFHTGYEADEDDWADVSALCARFAIPVPDDYARFVSRGGGTPRPA